MESAAGPGPDSFWTERAGGQLRRQGLCCLWAASAYGGAPGVAAGGDYGRSQGEEYCGQTLRTTAVDLPSGLAVLRDYDLCQGPGAAGGH